MEAELLLLLCSLVLAQDPQVGTLESSAEEPTAQAPTGTFEEGYAEGVAAAVELVDWMEPALLAAGAGAGVAGVGVGCGGLVCGAPAILGGGLYPAYKARRDVPAPPPGTWEQRSVDYRSGFIQGYQAQARKSRTRWALAGGATGVAVGTGVALVVLKVLYTRADVPYL